MCTASVNILHAPCYKKSAQNLQEVSPPQTPTFSPYPCAICYAGPHSASPALSHQSKITYICKNIVQEFIPLGEVGVFSAILHAQINYVSLVCI